jgi:hypothetical protein
MKNLTEPKAILIAALIAILGIVVGAFLNPLASKWINQPEPTLNPTSLAIEQIPLKLYTYQGDTDTTCSCVGVAHMEFRYDANLLPGYTLNYVFPDNNSNYGYAGLVFKFENAQNFSNYSAVEFSIVFSDPNDQANVDITDISGLKVPYHIVDNGAHENKVVIPFSNYKGTEFNAVSSIGFSANTGFSLGKHKFTVNNIRFIK